MRIRASFSFFAVLGFLICTDREGNVLLCAAANLLHETGHLALMFAEHDPPDAITFCAGGIRISGGSKSLPVIAAGIAVNLVLFAVCWLLPINSVKLKLFAVINLIVAAYNLLPIGELDGKRLLDRLLIGATEPHRAIMISEITGRICAALMIPAAVVLVFSGILNISALIFFFYIFAVEISEKI